NSSHDLVSTAPHPSFLMTPPAPPSTLFPYTTLFRSRPPAPRPAAVGLPARDRPTAWRSTPERLLPYTAVRRRAFRTTRSRGCTRSEEHTSELQSRFDLVCRLLLEKKK